MGGSGLVIFLFFVGGWPVGVNGVCVCESEKFLVGEGRTRLLLTIP
jgi:hypothetical protein